MGIHLNVTELYLNIKDDKNGSARLSWSPSSSSSSLSKNMQHILKAFTYRLPQPNITVISYTPDDLAFRAVVVLVRKGSDRLVFIHFNLIWSRNAMLHIT